MRGRGRIANLAARAVRLLAVTGVLNAALVAGALAVPRVAVACSCLQPQPGAPIFDGQEGAVLAGRVGPEAAGGRFNFAVERWFKGGTEATVLLQSGTTTFADGQTVTNTCGLTLVPGSHLVLAAAIGDGFLEPGSCSPHATVESAQGQRMIAAAEQAFGPGVLPGQPPPTGPAASPAIDLGLVAIVAVLGVFVLVVAVMVVAFGRRDASRADRS
jgi:hypothetical protein